MANTKSAQKKARADKKRTSFRSGIESRLDAILKKETSVPKIYKALDKAAKRGIMSKQKVARIKSRVAKKA